MSPSNIFSQKSMGNIVNNVNVLLSNAETRDVERCLRMLDLKDHVR